MRIILICLTCFALSHCFHDDDDPAPTPPVRAEFGLDQRPSNNSCHAPERPGTLVNTLSLVDAFPATTGMSNLLDMVRGPASLPAWWGIKQGGELLVLPDGAATAQTVLNTNQLRGFVSGGEQGLLGMSVDPYFPKTGFENTVRVLLYYTSTQCTNNVTLCSRISRFTFTLNNGQYNLSQQINGDPQVEDELMIVRQFASNHNGGAMRIGTDKLLYVTLGDGGSGYDPACAGQNLNTPLGKLLRIDINTVTGYNIPATNPYANITQKCNRFLTIGSSGSPDNGYGSPCPEIVAYGLRNPFRISVDQSTGYIWIGDVGQDAREEIDRLNPNDLAQNNFGWPLREGPSPVNNTACARLNNLNQDFVDPVYYYRHTDARHSVVGGAVYRGLELGDTYRGKYFFSEAYTGEVWIGNQPYSQNNIDVTGTAINDIAANAYGFTQDQNQELYMLAASGTPKKLQLSTGTVDNFPQTLSDTGCFQSQNPRLPSASMIPYSVNAPLWSDNAAKERYFAIPDDSTITVDADGDLQFPIGSVLSKTFRTQAGALLETRLLVRHQDGAWAGYAYQWNQNGTQATLVADETPIPQHNWTIPSRIQCLQCHTDAAGNTLGLEIGQLNGIQLYASSNRLSNQLSTLSHVGILDLQVPDPEMQTRLVGLQDEDVDWAVRSYLHSNCSHCHRPGGGTNSNMDLRHWISLADSGLCNAPTDPTAWPEGTLLINPGVATESLVWMRSSANDQTRMPPIGSVIPDANANNVLGDWINAMQTCP